MNNSHRQVNMEGVLMREELKNIFSNVNEWLKFAEAKNAGLIVFNLTSIFGAVAVITQKDPSVTIPRLISYYLYQLIILNGLGLLFALYSFYPQTQVESVLSKKIEDIIFKKPGPNGSVVFYGHIRDYDPASYLAKLCESCRKKVEECSNLESDYASQIVINSRIAFRKYNCFKVALFCVMSAIITPVLSVLLALIFKTINYIIIKQYKKSLISLLAFIFLSVIAWILIWKYVVL